MPYLRKVLKHFGYTIAAEALPENLPRAQVIVAIEAWGRWATRNGKTLP